MDFFFGGSEASTGSGNRRWTWRSGGEPTGEGAGKRRTSWRTALFGSDREAGELQAYEPPTRRRWSWRNSLAPAPPGEHRAAKRRPSWSWWPFGSGHDDAASGGVYGASPGEMHRGSSGASASSFDFVRDAEASEWAPGDFSAPVSPARNQSWNTIGFAPVPQRSLSAGNYGSYHGELRLTPRQHSPRVLTPRGSAAATPALESWSMRFGAWLGLEAAGQAAPPANGNGDTFWRRLSVGPQYAFDQLLGHPSGGDGRFEPEQGRRSSFLYYFNGEAAGVNGEKGAFPPVEEPWWKTPFWRKVWVGFGVWALVTILLFPKEPQWEVLDLQVDHVVIPALTGFHGMIDTLTSNSSAIQMTLSTTVRASNPNLIGANALPGVFNIQYKDTTIGQAASKEQAIGPLSSVVMRVQVHVDDVPTAMGLEMVRVMQDSNMQLPIMVTGGVIAQVWKLRVLTKILCDLKCDVSRLPERTTFTKKVCTYTYDLP